MLRVCIMKYLLIILTLAFVIIFTTLSLGIKNTEMSAVDTNFAGSSISVTLSELAQHNSMESCWVGYQNKVYDVTSYLPKHPGTAQRILSNCGTAKEFEQAFTKKHGTSKVELLMKVGVFIGDFVPQGDLE